MPHPYLNDLIKLFDGFTNENLKSNGNFRFMSMMRDRLKKEFDYSDTEVFGIVVRMKLDLANSLTDEELTKLADAVFDVMFRLSSNLADRMNVAPRYVLLHMPMDNFTVTLN